MRAEKQWLLDEIKTLIGESKSMFVTRYMRIPPNDSWELRENLAKKEGLFEVVKKRIFLKALEDTGVETKGEKFDGHIGVVFIKEDTVGPAKVVCEYSKNHNNTVEVLFGYIEGQYYSADDVKTLSKLPAQEEMRAQFLSTLEAPMSQVLAVIQSLLTSLLYCLENKSQNEEQKG